MTFLVISLYIPDCRVLKCQVVEVSCGGVVSISPFRNEVNSMMLVREAYVMPMLSLDAYDYSGIQTCCRYDGKPVCLNVVMPDGEKVQYGFCENSLDILLSGSSAELAADDCCSH